MKENDKYSEVKCIADFLLKATFKHNLTVCASVGSGNNKNASD